MTNGERRYITLQGGAPWGFRLQGGGHQPLTVSKIRKKSHAHNGGLVEGDRLVSINGVSVVGKSHENAMELIDTGGVSLTLELTRASPTAMEVSPPSFGSFSSSFVPPSHQQQPAPPPPPHPQPQPERFGLPPSTSLQSLSQITTQNISSEVSQPLRVPEFMPYKQTPTFAPKPWNPVPKPFTPVSMQSPIQAQVQVSAMYSQNEVKENIPPRRLSLQPYSERSPNRFSPRSTSPNPNIDRMPALNVWALKDMPKYQRPPPKKKEVAPPPPPPEPVKLPPPVAPKPPPKPPSPPPPPVHPAHLFAPPVGLDNTPSKLSDKKHYGDSAFYNDPEKNFPTIEEQMKLCKAIAQSLTSAANKKARGARMFAKRQKRAPNWVHDEATVGKLSSLGGSDVANLLDLNSELSLDDGGTKPLFSFRVPSNLKNRVNSPESSPKMSLSKDEFEKLRLKSQKNEHQSVSPNQCFDLVANLKSGKGRGAKLFEKRQKKAEKWVIDENNAKKTAPAIPVNRLDSMLMSPLKPYQSPWEAAAKGDDMSSAFDHLSEFEKQQRLNQILGYKPPQPAQQPQLTPDAEVRAKPIFITPVSQTSLKTERQQSLIEGKNFNRIAKGWMSSDAMPSRQTNVPVQQYSEPMEPPTPTKTQMPVFRDYNPKPKAWHGSQVQQDIERDSSPEPMFSTPPPAVWTPSNNPHDANMFSPSSFSTFSSSGQPSPHYYGQNSMNSSFTNGYSTPLELPGSDL